MSLENNVNLMERAQRAMEDLASHPGGIDKRIQQAVDNGDLDELNYIVAVAEGILSQEEFEHSDVH